MDFFVLFYISRPLCEVNKDLFDLILVAVLITGGDGDAGAGAELFLPSAGTSCVLPPFPDNRSRRRHTVDNNIICGGEWSRDTCLKWSPDTGSWEALLTLDIYRVEHVSWTPKHGRGTYLMGGWHDTNNPYPWNTSTLIRDDGTQKPAFAVKFSTE